MFDYTVNTVKHGPAVSTVLADIIPSNDEPFGFPAKVELPVDAVHSSGVVKLPLAEPTFIPVVSGELYFAVSIQLCTFAEKYGVMIPPLQNPQRVQLPDHDFDYLLSELQEYYAPYMVEEHWRWTIYMILRSWTERIMPSGIVEDEEFFIMRSYWQMSKERLDAMLLWDYEEYPFYMTFWEVFLKQRSDSMKGVPDFAPDDFWGQVNQRGWTVQAVSK